MSLRVLCAVPLTSKRLAPFAAPAGFPFVVQESDRKVEIVRPLVDFMFDRFLPVRRDQHLVLRPVGYSSNSAAATANDLKDWWEYLGHVSLDWSAADEEDVACYRDVMLTTISPHTHRPYAVATVRRRVGTVIRLYEWASANGIYSLSIRRRLVDLARRPIDRVPLAHISELRSYREKALPKASQSHSDHVKVFTPEEYQCVGDAIGTLPSRARARAGCHSRLAVETMLQTGMRLDEAIHITLEQARSLGSADGPPLQVKYLELTKTKGRKSRKVRVPNWLIREWQYYETHQRRHSLKARKSDLGSVPSRLFLNGPSAKQHCGKPLSAHALREDFYAAQFKAGVTRRELKYDERSNASCEVTKAKFRLHDLRHTFAVWTYYQEKTLGNSAPWKTIQSLLGHKHLSTTTDIYLEIAGELEAIISNGLSRRLRAVRARQDARA